MYMSRFSVKNYKCLADVDIPLTPIHVLIGENDSGKTSLLEAMAALYSSWKGRPRDVFASPSRGRDLVFHGAREARIAVCGQWTPSEGESVGWRSLLYQTNFDFQFHEDVDDQWESFVIADGERTGWTNELPRIPVLRVTKPAPKSFLQGMAMLRTTLGLTPLFSLHGHTVALPATLDPQRRFRFDPDGFGLPTLLDDILGYDVNVFTHLREQFCKSFPQFSGVRVETEEKAIKRKYQPTGMVTVSQDHGKGIHFELTAGGTIRAQQASDGVVLMLAFLALAHVPEPPKLLLLEEPENGIYPKRLAEVITLLKTMAQGSEGVRFPQIILSTHSPYLLSFFEPEEVTFLSRDPKTNGASVRARPMRDVPDIKQRLGGGAFYLGELWYNLSEEELFGDS